MVRQIESFVDTKFKMPTVSIIIPVHNPGQLLKPALESIMSQTFRDFEVVVVDDESKEDLSWVTREFPVRIIRQNHGGASIARNLGIVSTNSEYIAFMDQDDLWKADKLAHQVASLANAPHAGVCHCAVQFLFGTDIKPDLRAAGAEAANCQVSVDPLAPPAKMSALYASLNYFSTAFAVPSSVMLRRTALAASGLLDPQIPFFGDYEMLVKIGARHTVILLPAALTIYRWHESQFSGNIGRRVHEVRVLTNRYRQLGRATGDYLLARNAASFFGNPRKILGDFYFNQSRRNYRQKKYGPLAVSLGKSLFYDPLYVSKSCARWMASRVNLKRTS